MRCGNVESIYFYFDGTVWYCRKCVNFGRVDVGNVVEKKVYQKKKHNCKYHLNYELTKNQKEVVLKLNKKLQNGKDVLIYAACGAGKTEIIMQSIENYLNDGKKVGIAIARRQVVLEICERMQDAFPKLKVIAVCEGYTQVDDGDLIVCTMHQLYRYYQTFDLLVMDEIDAFPYAGNRMLEKIGKASCVGECIYLSATPDLEMLQAVKEGHLEMLELFVRPHGYPLVVPTLKKRLFGLEYLQLIFELYKQKRNKKQVLLFVPTIKEAKRLFVGLRLWLKCKDFTSKSIEKEELIAAFRKKKYQVLICTTVLERGITIDGVHIIVFKSNHMVFTEASLIQMVGRVGRKIENPSGEAILIYTKKTEAIKRCESNIMKMNQDCLHGEM